MRVQIIGAERFRDRIPHILATAPKALQRGLVLTGKRVVRHISRHLSTGRPYPKTDKGGLTSSFDVHPAPSANMVYVGSPLPYAPVHEFGATIPAHWVAPRRAKALHWMQGGVSRFSRGHMLPAITIPKRPYVQPALDKARGEMDGIMQRELEKVFGGA